MKTIALAFVGLVLFAQEPKPKPPTTEFQAAPAPYACALMADGTLNITGDPTACAEVLKNQIVQLRQQVAQKDQQIAVMQANIVASQKMFGACFQSLAEAEQRAAQKK
jgi:hypothetical protein